MGLNERIDLMKEDIINSTIELVKIKSLEGEAKEGMPFGEGPAEALNKALELCESLGFKTVNLDGYVGYAEYGEGEDYVAALGHLDVVPEGEGWTYAPYGGEIHDGKIFGRGTSDDKGPIVAALYGLKAIKDEGLTLSKRVRIIFGTNEETGSKELEYYLEKEKPPVAGFTPDADFPLINGEKGITIFDLVKAFNNRSTGDMYVKEIKGGQAANMVPDYCNAVLYSNNIEKVIEDINRFAQENNYKIDCVKNNENEFTIKCKGISAHGSTPELGLNSIMIMFKLLGTLNLPEDEIKDYITFMNDKIGMNLCGEDFGCYLEDEVSGKLSFNVGVVEMNNEKAVMTLNLRYPVTKTLDNMMEPFNNTLEGTGVRVENFVHQEPLYFAPEHPLVETLQKVYSEQTGEEAKLISIGGGTYAKEMPNILAFGPEFPGEESRIHKPDEFINIDNLIRSSKIYSHALYELAK